MLDKSMDVTRYYLAFELRKFETTFCVYVFVYSVLKNTLYIEENPLSKDSVIEKEVYEECLEGIKNIETIQTKGIELKKRYKYNKYMRNILWCLSIILLLLSCLLLITGNANRDINYIICGIITLIIMTIFIMISIINNRKCRELIQYYRIITLQLLKETFLIEMNNKYNNRYNFSLTKFMITRSATRNPNYKYKTGVDAILIVKIGE
ncbi:hypothetical protein RFI_29368 [Reticulomyxa filosa]|uniref:Uncharacterized protein n=1 Tax=Reticulomyxa filosa TaxID=46433 RepID=X6M311_RETFI|nr:hypothetical protein RFI_29368 [Reticulomyxa filosa]|eukprot:ETO08026.1 hypothetical protein RFI_29368 [Reticulomyxa filosa]